MCVCACVCVQVVDLQLRIDAIIGPVSFMLHAILTLFVLNVHLYHFTQTQGVVSARRLTLLGSPCQCLAWPRKYPGML